MKHIRSALNVLSLCLFLFFVLSLSLFPLLSATPFAHIVLGNVAIKRDNETKVTALL